MITRFRSKYLHLLGHSLGIRGRVRQSRDVNDRFLFRVLSVGFGSEP
jgi:hypothetical protein